MKLTLREIKSCIQALEFELAGEFMTDVLDEREKQRVADSHHSASSKLKKERDRRQQVKGARGRGDGE